MAYFTKPVEVMTEVELRACVSDPRIAEHVRTQAAMRLGEIRAQHDREYRDYDAHIRALKKKPKKINKPVGTVDARSVKHSAWNGVSMGAVTAAWATYKEAKETIGEIAGEALSGLDYAIQILHHMHFSDAEIVYIGAACTIGFILTLAWKFTQEY